MTTKLFALTFTIILLLFQTLFTLGQDAPEQQGWAAVQTLSTGVKLLVETKKMAKGLKES